jgi:hypothetical protein
VRVTLQLLPVRWFLIKETDMKGFLLDRRVSPAVSDLMMAASAQSVYQRPGVVAEARRLATLLGSLGHEWPSKDDVRVLLANNPAARELYIHEEQGDVWYLRSPQIESFEFPFTRNRWCLLWQSAGQMAGLTADGDEIIDMIRLMPLLDGTYTLAEVIAQTSNNLPARELLNAFTRSGVLSEAARANIVVDHLPSFVFLGHSGFCVRSGSDVLLVDPVGRPENERLGGLRRCFYPLLNSASAVLVSHHHWDHLDFQTISRIRRDMPMIVPRCLAPTPLNPPMAAYLSDLGFEDIQERCPGDSVVVGTLKIRLVPFRGEAFGLDSYFDGFTYHIRFGEHSLYGSVDACHDERGGMDEAIQSVSEWDCPDLFLFGSSEQEHQKPYLAGGLRHFSNELIHYPELLRYHPNFDDVDRWTRILKPSWLVPYAQFLFDGSQEPDFAFGEPHPRSPVIESFPKKYHSWLRKLDELSVGVGRPVVLLSPMQGIE